MFFGQRLDFQQVVVAACTSHIEVVRGLGFFMGNELAPQFVVNKACPLHGKTNHQKLRVAVRRSLQSFLSGTMLEMNMENQIELSRNIASMILSSIPEKIAGMGVEEPGE